MCRPNTFNKLARGLVVVEVVVVVGKVVVVAAVGGGSGSRFEIYVGLSDSFAV